MNIYGKPRQILNGLEVVSMGTEQVSDKTEKQKRDGYRSFYNRVTKRVLDLVLALAGSVIVTPILLVIGIFIAIEDGFPIFYTPLRGGYHGKPFHIIKLRTMYKGADKLGGTTALNDPRITRAGRLLRKVKLDELPQLYNVLLGSMSFVGPRPELLRYTEAYEGEEKQILEVRPGITDFSSIEFISLDEIVGTENAMKCMKNMCCKGKTGFASATRRRSPSARTCICFSRPLAVC